MMENQKFDVAIIGAGPAGLTAAIYSAWLGLKTIVLETGIIGGKALLAPKIENFPGFPNGISGSELVEKMNHQAERFHAEFKNAEVVGLDFKNKMKKIISREQSYDASAVIIATGTQRRKLHVSGETNFLGRGISYCAICDGPFFQNKKVAIIGNGEDAAMDALSLVDIANEITLVTQEEELDVEGTLVDRLKAKPNVRIVKGKVTKIKGEQVVEAIRIFEYKTQREVEQKVVGVFISLGSVPLTAIVKNAGIDTDRNGCLMVDRFQKTNIEGVFAAGDCTCGGMQVITAAGEGAMAAMKASRLVTNSTA
jgi:thioredoxin reductase (NADPH)